MIKCLRTLWKPRIIIKRNSRTTSYVLPKEENSKFKSIFLFEASGNFDNSAESQNEHGIGRYHGIVHFSLWTAIKRSASLKSHIRIINLTLTKNNVLGRSALGLYIQKYSRCCFVRVIANCLLLPLRFILTYVRTIRHLKRLNARERNSHALLTWNPFLV